MGVVDGSPVNASNTNAAFIDSNSDDTGFGIYTWANADPLSGPMVVNHQRAINRLFDAVGADNNTTSGTAYIVPNNTISAGDSHFVALQKLARFFAGITGHNHSGVDGQGPMISVPPAMTGSAGGGYLPNQAPQPVSGANGIGTSDGRWANQNHIHRGIASIAISGGVQAFGDVTLTGVSGVSIAKSGNNFQFSVSGSTGGGGGGGSSIQWSDEGPDAAVFSTEFGQDVYAFSAGLAQTIYGVVKVPTSYTAGNPITVRQGIYSPSAANTILITSTSYLIRKNTDAVNSTTNSRTSTNTALTNTVALQYREALLDISDSTGKINSVSISAGDLITVVVARGTDSDTADLRLIPSSTEVTFT